MEQERTTVTFNDNFAYDLEFGRIREQRLSEILLNKKIEVKTNGKEFCSLLFPVHALKTLLKGIKNPRIVHGGDDNAARLVLVPVGDIFKIAKSLK